MSLIPSITVAPHFGNTAVLMSSVPAFACSSSHETAPGPRRV